MLANSIIEWKKIAATCIHAINSQPMPDNERNGLIVPPSEGAPVELDALDHRLLDLLQADASRTNHALAEAAQVSPATALRRVRRLIDAGVIERQVAIVAPRLAETGLTAISEISLDR